MSELTAQDKIAVLLTSLSPGAAETLLGRLGRERAGSLRGEMQRLALSPPAPEMVDRVLRELDEVLRGARRAGTGPRLARGTESAGAEGIRMDRAHPGPAGGTGGADKRARGNEPPGDERREEPNPVGEGPDPIAELRGLEPTRLVAALQGEHPRTMSLILDCLETDKAADVLKRLPAEARSEVFIRLGRGGDRSGDLLPRIVRAVLQKSRELPDEPVEPDDMAKAQKLADLLRTLERGLRQEMLAALERSDEPMAARVKERLYVFEDLLLLENRSMQKLLGEVDSKLLALALKNAQEAIVEKVLGNLSKRARESLGEEMEFLGSVPPDKVQEAQKTIVDTIQRLDQAGDLVMQAAEG